MEMEYPRIFALGATRAFGEAIARSLGVPLARCEEREFEDGEHKSRPLDDVRGQDVYVVHSLYGDEAQSADEKLCRLLFFIGALRDAGAGRVAALLPYLCYARKDRRSAPGDPVTSRYIAAMFEAVGTDVVVALDVHNAAAFDNAFRCVSVRLEAQPLFVEHLAAALRGRKCTVVSPDEGGLKRADALRRALAQAIDAEIDLGFMEKRRSEGVVSGEHLYADVAGRAVVIIDDMISTGTTLQRAAHACRKGGAQSVHAAATHGLFTADAERVLQDPALDRVLVCDSVTPFRIRGDKAREKLTVIAASALFADAVRHVGVGRRKVR